MEECITQPHNGVAWCKLCLHQFTFPPRGVPVANLRSMYLCHLTGDHYHLNVKQATGGELMVLLQLYKMQVPEELQDGREEWPADLKLQWRHTVSLWTLAMLSSAFDRPADGRWVSVVGGVTVVGTQ